VVSTGDKPLAEIDQPLAYRKSTGIVKNLFNWVMGQNVADFV
jgi:hypothetical protein